MNIMCERALLADLVALYDRPWSCKLLKNYKISAIFGLTESKLFC